MKPILRLSIFLIVLIALVPVFAFARNGDSHTIYGGYGARSFYPGGYTVNGIEADSASGGGDTVYGSSALTVPGSSAYSTGVKLPAPQQPIAYVSPDAGSDYWVTGGNVYQ